MTNAPGTAVPMTRRDIEAKIVALAWQDDEFRQKFVANPKGQFEERLATKLPASLKMTVHEENANSLHFVIPVKPKGDLAELSDEDLEKIAGGTDVVVATLIAALAATVVTGSVGTFELGWK